MKRLWLLMALGLTTQLVTAQVIHPSLDDDPVFNQLLAKRLSYPSAFDYFPLYGRVYAGFQITQRGQISNISILSPGNTRSGFEYQVIQVLKHIPPLNPRYAGEYVLPVAFCYRNRTTNNAFYKPVNRLSDERLLNRLLLTERECLFDWAPKKAYADPIEVWGYYIQK